jgi:hypothetical protein
MGYDNEPWEGTGQNSQRETQFFVTLMMGKGQDDEKDYRPKRKAKEVKEDEIESVSGTSSETTSATTKDNNDKGQRVDKGQQKGQQRQREKDNNDKEESEKKSSKNRKLKKSKNMRTVDSVDRNKNSEQMAVLLDENRLGTSIPEETPLHGMRMPRRGVTLSSLTAPRGKDDDDSTHFLYKSDRNLINEPINKPEENFINNAGLIRRHTTLNTSYTIITHDYVQTAYAYIVVLPFLYIIRVSIGTGQTACHGARIP